MMSYYNQNVLIMLWLFGMFVIPGFMLAKAALWLGFPPLKEMHDAFYGEDDE